MFLILNIYLYLVIIDITGELLKQEQVDMGIYNF